MAAEFVQWGFLKSDYSDEGRDFPTGPEKAWSWTISYLRLKHLAQIRSRGPEKRPKTVPTTTFSTATSEKTTQNSGLITRQFAKSQAIIIKSHCTGIPLGGNALTPGEKQTASQNDA